LAIWTVIGLFFFSQDAARIVLWQEHRSLSEEFLARMLASWILALMTPLVLTIAERLRIERGNWPRMVTAHVVLSLMFALVELALETVVYVKASLMTDLLTSSFSSAYKQLLPAGFHENVVVYWLLVGVETARRYYRRYREQETTALRLRVDAAELKTQLVASRLNALKMQLQPHFLFNTLNAIVVLIRQGNTRAAEEMLSRLSDLLRAILDHAEAQEISLRRELDCLKLYLEIEKVRFGDRLSTGFRIDSDTLDAAVPHMSLQPLVENAVRHGICRRVAPGTIDVSARRVDGHLQIRIADDGPGPAATGGAASNPAGIGLSNTRARLRQLYGEAAVLRFEEGHPCGAVVTVEIPFRTLSDPDEPQRIELNEL